MTKNFLKEMFIDEAKPALNRYSGGGSTEPAKLYRHNMCLCMSGINDTTSSDARLHLAVVSSRSETIHNFKEFIQTFTYWATVPEEEGGGIELLAYSPYNGAIEIGIFTDESFTIKPCVLMFNNDRYSDWENIGFQLYYEGAGVDSIWNFNTYRQSIITSINDIVVEV